MFRSVARVGYGCAPGAWARGYVIGGRGDSGYEIRNWLVDTELKEWRIRVPCRTTTAYSVLPGQRARPPKQDRPSVDSSFAPMRGKQIRAKSFRPHYGQPPRD